MKKLALYLSLILFVVLSHIVSVSAQLTQYVIGGSGNEIATRVRYLPSDGSTIVAGYSYDITGGAVSNAQMALVKVTASGTIAWQKKFGVAGTSNVIQDMIITHDGNIVVVGTVGRATIYSGNVAAIMKFNATDGSLMWQKCMSATPVNTGGEVYFGVTELGATKSYELVAVGGSNFYPGLSSGLIGVYQSDGTLIYNDIYDVAGTGYLNGVTSNADSSGVYICGVYPGDYTDGSVFSYTPGTTTGIIIWSKYLDFHLYGSLQNNFLNDIYLSGSKLIIQGTCGQDYSTVAGQGQFVLTMNASNGLAQKVYGIQNSSAAFANCPKIAVSSSDHIYVIQSPYSALYDASLWTSGITTNTVITEITSLISGTSNAPVRFTSTDIGEHSIYDMRLQGGLLYLAGATNVTSGYGANDMYFVITNTSLSSTNHTCDTIHDNISITTAVTTAEGPTFASTTLTPTYYTIDTSTSSFGIKILCGDVPATIDSCLTNSLVINTGYNSITGMSISGSPEGGTPIPDPHWKLTAVTPSIAAGIAATPISGLVEVTAGNNADILHAPSVVIEYPYSNWISCVNSDVYVTDGTGPPPAGTTYSMTLSRCFKTCSADSIKLDMNIADDNYISSMDVDGIVTSFSQPVSMSTTNWSSFAHYITTLWLSGGSHCINIVVQNYNVGAVGENGFELNVYGTVSSATANIYSENSGCSLYSCAPAPICNTISLADTIQTCIDTSVSLLALVTGPDSIINIAWAPASGLSDTSILDPIAIVATTSATYYLTVTSLVPYNLVFNGDFNEGDTAFTSAYPYVSGVGSLVPTGVFAITTDPHLDHPDAASFGDHTTGSGNMMAINGASSPIDIWCQTITVTPNTYYDFSAWFANWSSDTTDDLPVIQFEINGVPIAGSFDFPHPDGVWTKYANSWYSGTDTTATICIHDSVTAASGNDFAIDDISFQQLCIAKDSVHILVAPKPSVDLGPDTTVCSGVPISLHSSYTYSSPSYLWNTGSTASSINPMTTDEYSLKVTVAGCSNADSVHIIFKPSPIISLGGNRSLCEGDSTTLTPFIGAGDSFFWSTGATTTAINVSTTGSYSISVDSNGCSSSDTILVTVFSLPIVNLGLDVNICQGDSVSLSSTGSYTLPTYVWSTGANTSSIYALSSGAYSLNVSQNGCLSSDTVNVHVIPLPVVYLGNDTSICAGSQIILSSEQPVSALYLWSDGSYGSSLNISVTGSYALTVTDSNCVASDTINVKVLTSPFVSLGPDTSLCSGSVIILDADVNNGSLLWSTGDTSEVISVSQAGMYSVIAENICGVAGDTVDISFYTCDIWFPNAFSPNGDGLNDIIRVRGTLFAFDHFALSIFNRWGARVFYTENIYEGWDGKVNNNMEDIGTYFYMITYHLEGKSYMLKGDFQLIR